MAQSHTPIPPAPQSELETDTRFPSGPWCGFFLMSHLPGRHQMELHLAFRQGVMTGEGRDLIGPFLFRGRYQVENGECWWTKKYIGKHDVFYHGYNEGKGIWGLWEIPPSSRGGFYIWPESMGDPTRRTLADAIGAPVETEVGEESEVDGEVGVGVGAGELVPARLEAGQADSVSKALLNSCRYRKEGFHGANATRGGGR